MLNTLLILLIFQTIGEGVVYALALPIPGPVIGMLLLFVYLLWKNDAVAKLAPASSRLLSHMSLLFVPACVGIIVQVHRLAEEWLPILLAVIVSTALAIVATALVVHELKKAD